MENDSGVIPVKRPAFVCPAPRIKYYQGCPAIVEYAGNKKQKQRGKEKVGQCNCYASRFVYYKVEARGPGY